MKHLPTIGFIVTLFLLGVFAWEHTPRLKYTTTIGKLECSELENLGCLRFGSPKDNGFDGCETTIHKEETVTTYVNGINGFERIATTTISYVYCYKKSGHWYWPER